MSAWMNPVYSSSPWGWNQSMTAPGWPPNTMPGTSDPFWAPQQQQPQLPMGDLQAVSIFQSITDEVDTDNDGNITAQELEAARENKNGQYSKEEQAAMSYLLTNQNGIRGKLDNLDGKGDNLISIAKINEFVANPNVQGPRKSNTQVLLTLLKFMEENGWSSYTRENLAGLANDENIPADVREAAKRVVETPELMATLDTARDKNGDYDGKASHDDLKSALKINNIDQIGNPPSTAPATSASAPVMPGAIPPGLPSNVAATMMTTNGMMADAQNIAQTAMSGMPR